MDSSFVNVFLTGLLNLATASKTVVPGATPGEGSGPYKPIDVINVTGLSWNLLFLIKPLVSIPLWCENVGLLE